ncbi:fibronectin type III domain-containing protein [Verrucomicrobia bacterium S94]|nr:fibronectin type III domain-containing protein [Verrucomicrobia bacterium S94]
MKRLMLSVSCACMAALSVQAVELFSEDFSTWSDGDINGISGWIASTNGWTNAVVNGELMLEPAGDRIMNSTAGAELNVGESVRLTMDYRVSVAPERRHSGCFGFGIQTNDSAVAGSSDELINAYMFIFGQEASSRADGQVHFFPDNQQWNGPGTYVMSGADCGMNPYGYYTNAAPYDDVAYIDADSDVLRSVYTVTKSHITNQFNITVSTSNLSSGVYYSGSDYAIERPAAWAAPALYATLYGAGGDHAGNTNYIQKVTLEKLPVSIDAPTGVGALGLDGQVDLTWNIMPGATEYDIFRTETAGDYSGVTPITVSSESYSDTSVVNGTTYYYSIVAKYADGDSAMSVEVSATPKTIYSDTLVYSTDFSGMNGDLAGDAEWSAVSGSSNNAFNVITDAGTNWADTVSVSNFFDETVGNAVYLDRLIRNDVDDAVEGSFDVVVSVTASGTDDSDHNNQGVLSFGITSSSTEALDADKAMMAMFYLGVRAENNIYVTFGQEGNDIDSNRLAFLGWSEAGWNPKPVEAVSKSWLGNPAAPRDLVTDLLRVRWKIRKTREPGVYQAWASLSNTVSGVVNTTSTLIEFETDTMQEMYDAVAGVFAMGRHPNAKKAEYNSELFAAVENVSISHSSGNLPEVIAPTVTSVLSGDRSVIIEWEPVLDALGGYTLTVETPDNEVYVVADGISETTFTDAPRWNGETNTYTLTANFDSDLAPNTASTNFAAAPIGLETVFAMDGSYGAYVVDFVASNSVITNAGNTVRYVDYLSTPLFVKDENGYTGPTLYALLQQDIHENTANFYAEASTDGGGKIGLSTSAWNAFGNGLFFMPVSDMGYGASTLDAVNNAPLSTYVYFGSWTWGAGNGSVRAAVRNGSTWYVSGTKYAANYISGGEPKPVFVPDVAAETWYELDISDPSVHLAPGASTDGSGFTDVNAMGWYFDNAANAYVYEMEVKISGALGSYDYWALNSGLVSSNSAAGLDPDGDLVVNSIEYAFGGDPLDPENVGNLPVMDASVYSEPGTGDDAFVYVYRKRRDPISGITYNLKSTENLMTGWSSASFTAEESVLDYEWMVVTNYLPLTSDQLFIQLDVE